MKWCILGLIKSSALHRLLYLTTGNLGVSGVCLWVAQDVSGVDRVSHSHTKLVVALVALKIEEKEKYLITCLLLHYITWTNLIVTRNAGAVARSRLGMYRNGPILGRDMGYSNCLRFHLGMHTCILGRYRTWGSKWLKLPSFPTETNLFDIFCWFHL